MIQKIRTKLKTFFISPQDIISFFLPIIIAIILLIPVPYTITIGGGTINIDNKINVVDEYNSKGSLNSAYVREVKGTIGSYLLAKIVPSYKIEKNENIILENEDISEYSFREKMYFTNSLDSAVFVAFNKANKKIEIIDSKIYIIYIDETANTELKIKDQVLKVNDKDISSIKEFSDILNNYKIGDILDITVLRNNKEIKCKSTLLNINDIPKIGIYLMSDNTYKTENNVDFEFTSKESGPSGGLMIALSIYNKLVEDDITKGYKIVGTGTIDEFGNVGEIGGVKYKLAGAVKNKADIFLCPKENYKEAINIKEKYNYNIRIISVDTFDNALEELKKYK